MSLDPVDEYFAGKPGSREIFEVIAARIAEQGPSDLMLGLDRRVEKPGVRDIAQVGKSRWNHQIVVRSREDARAYSFGAR